VSTKTKKIDRRWIWIGLGILSLIVRFGCSLSPDFTERYYSRGLFQGIRWCFDKVVWLSPIPVMYIFFIAIFSWLIYKLITRSKENLPFGKRLLNFLFSLTAFASALVFFFLFLWGYNYLRIPIEDHLHIEPKPLNISELRQELELATEDLIVLRNAIPNATSDALNATFFPNNMEENVNQAVELFLQKHDYPSIGKVNGRFLRPKGILLYNSTSGIYFPYTGESNIDAGLHPLTQPYTLAHEFGHGYGFGEEGTCNFIAYLACQESQHPFIRYSGMLGYWRTLAGNYKYYEREKYAAFRAALPQGIIADLNIINETHLAYPDIFPKLRNQTYDAFLKAQGIKEGIESYDRVIMLGAAWRAKHRLN